MDQRFTFLLSAKAFAITSTSVCLLLTLLYTSTNTFSKTNFVQYYYHVRKPAYLTNNNASTGPIRIHYYNPPQWVGPKTFDKCNDSCFITFGNRFEQYSTSEFVIFHAGFNMPPSSPKKIPGQTWIFHVLEPPFLTSKNLKSWKEKFNWTLSYRRDSDITHTYGTFLFKKDKGNGRINLTGTWENKTKGAAWFVSHPKVPSKRAEFVKKIREFINVDIFGRQSQLKCPSPQQKDCNALLRNHYKFYLSFENSLCRDYVTEKGYKIYQDQTEVIPIVRGTTDYSIFFPPHSYIDTTQFRNISSLVKFQNILAQNKSEFEEYFQWRKNYFATPTGDRAYCALCTRAHNATKYKTLYGDIETWYFGKGINKMCRDVADIK